LIILIYLFDGIGGSRRAFELLGCEVASYVACEMDVRCHKVVKACWPEAILVRDVRSSGRDQLLAARAVAPHAKVVCLISGPPCQDISGVNGIAKGVEGERSGLYHEVARVRRLIKKYLGGLLLLEIMENVASMDSHGPHARQALTASFGELPAKLDAASISLCRRPRYYWCRPPVASCHNLLVVKQTEKYEIVVREAAQPV
jgi:site-specific DNA-cytosine methylase